MSETTEWIADLAALYTVPLAVLYAYAAVVVCRKYGNSALALCTIVSMIGISVLATVLSPETADPELRRFITAIRTATIAVGLSAAAVVVAVRAGKGKPVWLEVALAAAAFVVFTVLPPLMLVGMAMMNPD